MVMDGARNADLARRGQLLQTRGDVHPVAIDIALLDDHIADVDADAESDALLLGQLPLALGHAPLDRRGTLDRIYNAPNSTSTPSPMSLATRPWCSAIGGSMKPLRSAFKRAMGAAPRRPP